MHIVSAWNEALKRNEAVAAKVMEKGMDLAAEGKADEAKEYIKLANEIRAVLKPFTE